ncbi:MAG: hypothetical protein JWL82_112 [Parcubacteria group bacterium]|nr:hypothetical protein [Parcubacteria group bacterium]
MNFSKRLKLLLTILVIVAIGAVVFYTYFWNSLPLGTVLFPNSQNANPTLNGTPATGPSKTTGNKPTTPRAGAGYVIQTSGKSLIVTSTAAGVTVTVPLNTVITQANAVLSLVPPESKSGEGFKIQKTEASFNDPLPGIASALSGKQSAFDALRSTEDSQEFNPNNVVAPSHITKLKNLTVDGHPAVQVHVTTTATAGQAARDFYLTWVREGITNWYIVRTAQGLTPEAKSALDLIFTSIKLLPQ